MSKYQALIDALKAGPTGGEWKAGKGGGSVVSDQHVEHGPNGCDCVEYYGGHLIAESIARRNLDYIAAANPSTIRSLLADLDRAEKDAERYRWLRARVWNDDSLCVVTRPGRNVVLGADCPSGDRLDAAIDAALSQLKGQQ